MNHDQAITEASEACAEELLLGDTDTARIARHMCALVATIQRAESKRVIIGKVRFGPEGELLDDVAALGQSDPAGSAAEEQHLGHASAGAESVVNSRPVSASREPEWYSVHGLSFPTAEQRLAACTGHHLWEKFLEYYKRKEGDVFDIDDNGDRWMFEIYIEGAFAEWTDTAERATLMNHPKYVVGFMFDGSLRDQTCRVALIRKNKPDWQRGKLNGIGGKIEDFDASPTAAMIREFEEEAGGVAAWRHYATMVGPDWTVECFAARGDIDNLISKTDEKIECIRVPDVNKCDTIENLSWLVAMAIDHLEDGRPIFATVRYP